MAGDEKDGDGRRPPEEANRLDGDSGNWQQEFQPSEDDDTTHVSDLVLDVAGEAVPEAATEEDTDKYKNLAEEKKLVSKTLPGHARASDDIYFARGRLRGREEVFVAIRLLKMRNGKHPATAHAEVDKIREWVYENEQLIRAILDG